MTREEELRVRKSAYQRKWVKNNPARAKAIAKKSADKRKGLAAVCRRKHYLNHREEILKRSRQDKADNPEREEKRRQKKYAAWMEIIRLAGKDRCSLCGYNKCFWAIDFHHREPSEKLFAICSILHLSVTEARVLELGKCDALCRNCHYEIHYKNGGFGRSKSNQRALSPQ